MHKREHSIINKENNDWWEYTFISCLGYTNYADTFKILKQLRQLGNNTQIIIND